MLDAFAMHHALCALRLSPPTILADSVKTYFDPLDQAQKRAREGLGVQVDLVWAEAFHFTAFYAIEMGVRLVVGIWGHTVAKRAIAGTNALNQFVSHQ